MYRTLLTADAIANQLGQGDELAAVGRRFFARFQKEAVIDSLMPDSVGSAALEVLELAQSAPQNINRLLSDLTAERLVLRLRTSDSPEDRRDANTRTRLLAAAALAIAIAVLLAGYRNNPLLARLPLTPPLLVTLALILVWIVMLWRRLK